MKNQTVKIIAFLLVVSMLFSFAACGAGAGTVDQDGSMSTSGDRLSKEPFDSVNTEKADPETDADIDEKEHVTDTVEPPKKEEDQSATSDNKTQSDLQDENISDEKDNQDYYVTTGNTVVAAPAKGYIPGVVLVKVKDSMNEADLGTLDYASVTQLYAGSRWYTVRLTDGVKAEDAVTYLIELGTFDSVDYDYVMTTGADAEEAKVTDNPNYGDQTNLGLHNIPYGWTQNGKHPGGSPDVVIAVIDTGVDYNHLDLRNNIWVNAAEIAGNGKDDDGNGYVDDVYGWDCVGNDNDPMDDNGHGTHVAGIIAAENNKVGGIGVAYNCKVMVLKAGNSSGYFNNSDIAEAIQYAYMNGADVINMSFGGSSISIAVEEALENAYNSCVLVAAAGNDSACNNIACPTCPVKKVSYPAALPYVIGVMSTDKEGKHISSFSNYDHDPYNTIEYEVYAVGESVGSTWPSNKYACLNGTSMAAPTVAGIAALLRSYYADREAYSTKFIQSQIINTGSVNPYNAILETTDNKHFVADIQEAMTKLPKPSVNLYDHFVDDSTAISANNNGNGVIDAGETVRLHISLHNRGGVATDLNVTIDTYRREVGNEVLTDPYFTLVNTAMQLSDIGTYSVRESGDQYFEIVVSADCPNDYLADFNIRFTYMNGLDEKDKTEYSGDGVAQFRVSRGFLLPSTITEDVVYKADKLYIVGQNVVIPQGVTVTFEEGCEIQFYDDRVHYNSPVIINYGTLNFTGTQDNMIKIAPNEQHMGFACGIRNMGKLSITYVDAINLLAANMNSDGETTVYSSRLAQSCIDGALGAQNVHGYWYGQIQVAPLHPLFDNVSALTQMIGHYVFQYNYIELKATDVGLAAHVFTGNTVMLATRVGVYGSLWIQEAENNMFISEDIGSQYDPARTINVTSCAKNNYFTTTGNTPRALVNILFENKENGTDNAFSPLYQQYADQVIDGYYDSNGNTTVDVYGPLTDESLLWPYVVSVEMFDKDGNPITTIGKEEIKVRVTFNRPMDTTQETYLTFGTIEPYADYRINGAYVSDTVWEGTYTLKAQIENGQNFLKVNNACAAEDPTKTVFGEYQLHEFTIDTTAAMSMNLQAVAKSEGIELTFAQDDYATLLGYNIYRSEDKDGNFVRINPTLLMPEENTFLDENAEPGKTYWYTYTVVLSDFTESKPAGKVMATAMDTMSPSLYHTPVNQGYENNNLVISCTASDNVSIQSVTLYYRAVGATEWKTLSMSRQNDKYSAKIFGSDVTLAGLEYYIVATDGRNAVMKGSAETPYSVVIKSADSLLGMGDVDGNGTVTTKDALMLMQCLSGDLLLADDAFKRADLNGDGVLSAVEALRILQYVNGKVTTLEM